jgi:hypothetical protein
MQVRHSIVCTVYLARHNYSITSTKATVLLLYLEMLLNTLTRTDHIPVDYKYSAQCKVRRRMAQ